MELLNVDRPEDREPNKSGGDESRLTARGRGSTAPVSRVVLAGAGGVILAGIVLLMMARTDIAIEPDPEPDTTEMDDEAEAASMSVLLDDNVVITECVVPLNIGLPAGHAAPVTDTVFTPEGRLISMSEQESVTWAARSATRVNTLIHPAGTVSTPSVDGALIVHESLETRTITIVDSSTGVAGLEIRGDHEWGVELGPVVGVGPTPGSRPDSGVLITLNGQSEDLVATVRPLGDGSGSASARSRTVKLDGAGVNMSAGSWYQVAGDEVLVARPRNSTLVAWDLTTGERIPTETPVYPDYRAEVVMGLGDSVVVVGTDGQGAVPIDLVTGRSLADELGLVSVDSLTNSPDGAMLAASGRDGTGANRIRVWDLATDTMLGERTVPTPAAALSISHDGDLLAWADPHGGVYLAELDAGLPTIHDEALVGHSGRASTIIISDDGGTIVTEGIRTVQQWEVSIGAPSRVQDARLVARLDDTVSMQREWASGAPIGVHVDGDLNAKVWILDATTEAVVKQVAANGRAVGASINDDGTLVAILVQPMDKLGGTNHSIEIRSVDTGELLGDAEVLADASIYHDIDISPSGRHIALLVGDEARFFCVL